MSRDHRKLRIFVRADELLLQVYRISARLPPDERFGVQRQLRRAAVSVATNIVEGSARRTQREYVNFLNIALGSCAEVGYLIDVVVRLGLLRAEDCADVSSGYAELLRSLRATVNALEPISPKA